MNVDARHTCVYVRRMTPPDVRDPITIRLRPTSITALDTLAAETSTDRSKAARALIGAALASPSALAAARTMLSGGNL